MIAGAIISYLLYNKLDEKKEYNIIVQVFKELDKKEEYKNYKRYKEIYEIIKDIPNNYFSEVKMLKKKVDDLYENGFYADN